MLTSFGHKELLDGLRGRVQEQLIVNHLRWYVKLMSCAAADVSFQFDIFSISMEHSLFLWQLTHLRTAAHLQCEDSCLLIVNVRRRPKRSEVRPCVDRRVK